MNGVQLILASASAARAQMLEVLFGGANSCRSTETLGESEVGLRTIRLQTHKLVELQCRLGGLSLALENAALKVSEESYGAPLLARVPENFSIPIRSRIQRGQDCVDGGVGDQSGRDFPAVG